MSTSTELDARRARAAKSESLLRAVNERIEHLSSGSRTIDFACECADDTCTKRVTMTIAEYEEIRADSNSFLVLPGHVDAAVENVLGEEPGYVVVAKKGVGGDVADKLDPRTRAS
jgi:hypothetical protein